MYDEVTMTVSEILRKDLAGADMLTVEELRFLMNCTDQAELDAIYKKAYEVKARNVDTVAYYRGLIELDNS